MANEIRMWKEIKGFENYEVSNCGEVRNKTTGRVLKPSVTHNGYLRVTLCSDGKQTNKSVHRLVSGAFIPNPDNKSDVNHIDEDKTNNSVSNLEWLTHKENANHGTRNERVAATLSMPIYALYPDGTDEYYPSASVVACELGLSQGNICSVLNGQRKTAGGLRFAYAE